jgi:multidrug efflux system outer membrane protein
MPRLRVATFATGVLAGGIMLAGCTLAPAYRRPVLPVPTAYPTAAADSGESARSAADIGWREFFGDVRLQGLIAMALVNNRDLRVALLNVENARAQYRIQRSQLLPTLDASATEDAAHSAAALTTPGLPATTHEFSATVGLSAYELDLFGRLRSLNAQALETYFGTVEARRSTQLTLVAEVAGDYLNLAADQELLALARDTVRSQDESYQLTVREAALGFASELAVRQAQTPVETARYDEARYSSLVAQDRDALELLVGAALPDALLPPSLTEAVRAMALNGNLPEGLPSDLMQQRPDVAEAEHTLRAANANIGAARAAFYPAVTLTSSGGTESLGLSGLFKSGSSTWSFAPQISLPIFAGGRNRANLDSATISRDIDVAKYEHAIQTAFREVADALAQRSQYGRQLSAQESLVEATGESHRLAESRFQHGADTYLNVLDAQRSLYSAQQTLITTQLGQASNLVTLYKALGGGLNEHSPPPSAARTLAPPALSFAQPRHQTERRPGLLTRRWVDGSSNDGISR